MDYRKNYIKIYIWQTISVLLGFAALFVVVPYISSNKTIYGVYSVCTSLTIFFSYADLGFLSSGVKYAAEYYIKGLHQEEVRIIGFTSYIMVSVFAVLALGIIILGFFPKLLIPELINGSDLMSIARWLLFILAFSCPVLIGQRLLNLIFTIRVEDYKFQRLCIVGNILRILSVFIFFGSGRYLIVEYYLFYQAVGLGVVIWAFIYAKKNYNYSIKEFLSSFRFDREVFNRVKYLTGTALIITLSSILFLELDQVVISNILGIEAVAVYAAALSVMQLVRTFCSIVYSPYTSRYNHFVGLNDYEGLTYFVRKMIYLFAPVLIIPLLSLSINAEPFVVSWVGEQYRESGFLVSFLVLCFVFNFIKDPVGAYFVATERNKVLIRYNLIIPVVYWVGIAMLVGSMGSKAFAIMKFIAPTFNVIAYWLLAKKDFINRGYRFLSMGQLLQTVIPTLIIVLFFSWFFGQWMIEEHSSKALLINILLIGTTIVCSMLASIPFNSEIKKEVLRYYNGFYKKFER